MEESIQLVEKYKNRRPLDRFGVLAFLLGLLSTNNVVYLFVVGSTPILFCYLYACLCLVILAAFNGMAMPNFFYYIPTSLKIFLGFVVFSIVPVIVLNSEYISRWLNGGISLLLCLLVIACVLWLRDYEWYVYMGIAIGVILNAVFVLYAYVFYLQGSVITLADAFPAWGMPVQVIYNIFRGWGFFREPGHLMRYVAIVSIPVYEKLFNKASFLSYVYLISVFIILAFTVSSSSFIFLVGLIVYLIFRGKAGNGISQRTLLTVFLAIVIVVIYMFSNASFFNKVTESLLSGLLDLFNYNGETRLTGMNYCLEIIKDYPLIGCGWNLMTSMFQKYDFYGVNDAFGSYSEGLSLIAELGVGSVFYLYFILASGIKLIRDKNEVVTLGLGVSLFIYLMLFFMTDYSIDAGSAVFIGLALCELDIFDNQRDELQNSHDSIAI